MKPYTIIATLLAYPLFCIAAPFQNGSFELPGLTTIATQQVLTSNELQGWTKTGPGRVSLLNGKFGAQQFDPVDGVHQINFSGGDNPTGGVLSQTFDTVVGVTYEVSFYVGRVGPGSGDVGITASVRDSTNTQLFNVRITPPAGERYGSVSLFTFTATTTSTTLSFEDSSLVTSSVDMALDAVSVYPQNQTTTLGIGFYACLEIEGRVGGLYRIEFKESLTEPWQTLTTLKISLSPFLFVDPNSKGRAQRFYRIIPIP